MDPCPFVRVLVGNLSIKTSPTTARNQYFGRIKFKGTNFPIKRVTVPSAEQQERQSPTTSSSCSSNNNTLAACFTLSKAELEEIVSSSTQNEIVIKLLKGSEQAACGWEDGKVVGKIRVPLDLRKEIRGGLAYNGWISVGENQKKGRKREVHVTVRVEPDPRYVFEFGGEPECSPQVFQVQGNVRQAVFTCKFSFRCQGDRNLHSMQSMSEQSTLKSCLSSLRYDKDQNSKERKGWTVTIHDLSGSPVAMASMVTPFVPSPGSDHVSQSNPGAWLILRPSNDTWKPWGRLEAWRGSSTSSSIGFRFELYDNVIATPTTIAVANSSISTKTGGKFVIDMTNSVTTPVNSPRSSCDFGSGSATGSGSGSWGGSDLCSQFLYKGFIMSSTVKAGRGKCSKPEVVIGVQHVTCTEDAAAYVALAAAVDLSVDACSLFSHKLRKELRHQPDFCRSV